MPVDYNKTINLPKTDFPMRAGLPKREPGFLEEWKEDGVFEELLKINADKPKYVLHDGPPSRTETFTWERPLIRC